MSLGTNLESEPRDWRLARRHRIVAAAEAVFARSGFATASMDEIAQAAGVGKPTLYRYFESKSALFLAVFEDALDAVDGALAASADAAGQSPRQRFTAMIGALVPFFRQHFATWRDLGAEGTDVDRERRELLRARRDGIEQRIAAVVRAGELMGAFRPGVADMAPRIVIGAVWGGATAFPSAETDLAAAIADLFLTGLDARPANPAGVP